MYFKALFLLIAFILAVCAVAPAISESVCPDNVKRCTELCQAKGKSEGFCGGFMENLCFCRNE